MPPPAHPLLQIVQSEDFQKKRQQGIGNRLFADAAESDAALRELGTDIAKECGCRTSFGPIKSLGRSEYKVNTDYRGDWYQLKDVVRMTIIAPNFRKMLEVRQTIVKRCVLGSGLRLLKNTEIHAVFDPCGYSGFNFVVRLKNERPAEIQVNLPEMIFGKEKKEVALKAMPYEMYYAIRDKYRIDGGRGHALYEIYRDNPAGVIGKQAARASKLYYTYLRGFPCPRLLEKVKLELQDIMKKEPSKFLH